MYYMIRLWTRYLIDLCSLTVVMLLIIDFFYEGSLISASLSTSGFRLELLGHSFDNQTSLGILMGFVSLLAMRFFLLQVVVEECDCWCGPGKCECGCACHGRCPCCTRSKSDKNDLARRNSRGWSIWN